MEKTVPISKLRNWKDNPKGIRIKDMERLKKQIKYLSQFVPGGQAKIKMYKPMIAFPENGKYIVLGGNQRLLAARELGMEEIEIRIVHPKTEADKLAIALSDNDRAGEYDDQALGELGYREKDKIDMDMFRIDLGSTLSMEALLNSIGPKIEAGEEDEVPPAEVEIKSKPGDLYKLGPHRLFCADATKAESYKALLGEKEADLIFTDPPYSVSYTGNNECRDFVRNKFGPIIGDDMTDDEYIEFVITFISRMKEVTKKGGVFYICTGYTSYPVFIFALKKAGLTFFCPIVWIKRATTFGFRDYKLKHEMLIKSKRGKKQATPILYGWNKGKHYFADVKTEIDVWEMAGRSNASRLHPTQKPLGLVQRAIRNSSKPGQIVLDPFAGSGSTLIAAEREGRISMSMELDPQFIDVIIRRYAALGGPDEKEIRKTKETIKHE